MIKKAWSGYKEMSCETASTFKNWRSKEPYHGFAKASAVLWVTAHLLFLSGILQSVIIVDMFV